MVGFTPQTRDEIQRERLWPKGIYDFEVLAGEDKRSSKGADMIELEIRIYDSTGRKMTVKDWLLEAMKEKMLNFCEATDRMDLYNTGNLQGYDCVGAAGKLKLIVDPGKGTFGPSNKVKDYIVPKKDAEGENPAEYPKESEFVPHSQLSKADPEAKDDQIPF